MVDSQIDISVRNFNCKLTRETWHCKIEMSVLLMTHIYLTCNTFTYIVGASVKWVMLTHFMRQYITEKSSWNGWNTIFVSTRHTTCVTLTLLSLDTRDCIILKQFFFFTVCHVTYLLTMHIVYIQWFFLNITCKWCPRRYKDVSIAFD